MGMTKPDSEASNTLAVRVLVKLSGGFGHNVIQILAGHALARRLSGQSAVRAITEVIIPDAVEPQELPARNYYDPRHFPQLFETLGGYLKSDLHFHARHRQAALPPVNDLPAIFPHINWRNVAAEISAESDSSDTERALTCFETDELIATLEGDYWGAPYGQVLDCCVPRSFFPNSRDNWYSGASVHGNLFEPAESVRAYLRGRYGPNAGAAVFGIHLRTTGRHPDPVVHGHHPAAMAWYVQCVEEAARSESNLRVVIVANQIVNNPAPLGQAYALYDQLKQLSPELDVRIISDEPWYIDFALLRDCHYLATSTSLFGFAAAVTSACVKRIFVPRVFQHRHLGLTSYPASCVLEANDLGTVLPAALQWQRHLLAQRQGPVAEPGGSSLTLVTSYYVVARLNCEDRAVHRQEEYEQALERNLKHPLIQRVVLFVQGEAAFDRIQQLDLPNPHKLECLVIRNPGERGNFQPMVRDIWAYCQHDLQGELCLVASADDYLADDVRVEYCELLPGSGKVFALTRHEADGCTPQLDVFRGSHDAFLFRSPLLRLNHSRFDFFQNDPGCENVIIAKLVEAGYHVSNPARRMRIMHLHTSEMREGPTNRVNHETPYFEIKPEPSMTLVYNQPQAKTFSFIVSIDRADHHLDTLISCLLAQSCDDWMMIVVSDGPDADTEERMKRYCQAHTHIVYGQLDRYYGDGGHSPREAGMRTTLDISHYTIMTSVDDYYMPIFVESFKSIAEDRPALIYCDFVLSHFRDGRKYNAYLNAKPQLSYIDTGCMALRNDYLKELGTSRHEYAAKSSLVEIAEPLIRRRKDRIVKIPQTLFVHN